MLKNLFKAIRFYLDSRKRTFNVRRTPTKAGWPHKGLLGIAGKAFPAHLPNKLNKSWAPVGEIIWLTYSGKVKETER